MLPVPVEEGKGKEGEEKRATVAVNFWGVGWGRHSQLQVLLALGSAVSPGRSRVSGSESSQPDSRVGEGRRSRHKPHGEGAG